MQPTGLIIEQTESKGNGWKSTQKFTKGDVIFIEKPLAVGVFTDLALSYCGSCFVNMTKIRPEDIRSCNICFSFACCPKCEENEEVWKAHSKICRIFRQNKSSNDEDESAYARLFLHSLLDPSYSLCKASENADNCLQGDKEKVIHLVVNEDGINSEVLDAINHWSSVIAQASKNDKFRKDFSGIKQIESFITKEEGEEITIGKLEEKLKDFFKKVVYNWHSIPADNMDEDDDIGYAIFPFACYFNHSCSPNVAWKIDRLKSSTFYATALKDINEGDEILISYFGDDQKVSTHRRQDYLQEYYQFTCDCDRCKQSKDCYLCEAESKYLCSRCKNIKYCSATCQKKHWRAHKKDCLP